MVYQSGEYEKKPITDQKWKEYCKLIGCAYIPLHECLSKYADMPVALREYVRLKEEGRI